MALYNSEYIMLPFGELERKADFLFDTIGQDGRLFIRPDSPLKLFTGQELASTMASLGHEPDPVWIVDICKTSDSTYHLLEIGGFSFADLYACNKADVVAAVSEVAHAVWRGAYA